MDQYLTSVQNASEVTGIKGKKRLSPLKKMVYERRRIKSLNKLYYHDSLHYGNKMIIVEWPIDLSEEFLNIQPRPTIKEMRQVIEPLGLNTRKYRDYIPNPDRPGYLKYDSSQWVPDPDRPGSNKYNFNNEYVNC